MNQLLLSTTKHFFAQCVFMNSIHYKAYDRLEKKQNFYRNITAWISGSTLILIILEVVSFHAFSDKETINTILSVLSYVGLILTAVSLLFTMFHKEDISEIKINHRLAAETYKELRDSYLLLIEEIASNDNNLSELRNKSREYQKQYSNIGKYSPTTTYSDYQATQKGLGLDGNSNEEFTWSDEEINRFLPKKLRVS
ncbi:SLATT domain-containing protein [Draconibacterium mangrovi]|uniref:SLATT domain-containing protein n=1 Tax=Draconibacterium mangrovi TaxID=2697469 RepID=UPI0013CFBDC2|nr:SLATT domain-containing protein [Draconibacterium mangrovi]